MPMYIGALRFGLQVPESDSLKDKRQVVRSVTQRLRNEFRVTAAEVGQLDSWQVAEIGVAVVGNDSRFVEEVIAKALDFVERGWPEFPLIDVETETIQAF